MKKKKKGEFEFEWLIISINDKLFMRIIFNFWMEQLLI